MAAVIALIRYKGKVLVGRKKDDSSKKLRGMWHILGERIEEGETDEEALRRCALEEVGLTNLVIGDCLGSHTTPTSKSEARWYECFADTDQITPSSDLEEARWEDSQIALKLCSPYPAGIWPSEVVSYLAQGCQ